MFFVPASNVFGRGVAIAHGCVCMCIPFVPESILVYWDLELDSCPVSGDITTRGYQERQWDYSTQSPRERSHRLVASVVSWGS